MGWNFLKYISHNNMAEFYAARWDREWMWHSHRLYFTWIRLGLSRTSMPPMCEGMMHGYSESEKYGVICRGMCYMCFSCVLCRGMCCMCFSCVLCRGMCCMCFSCVFCRGMCSVCFPIHNTHTHTHTYNTALHNRITLPNTHRQHIPYIIQSTQAQRTHTSNT
jgi:hypothetical protein